ncbi:MAG: transposase zinc-binding domain-containing protein [Desulfobacterales bacterium]|nr:transposase zinc-binding domain-containing protein [Desulfobacterales bacterium]
MSTVQKIFQMYGAQYLALYGDRMPRSHKKAIRDIIKCRNGFFGTMVYECRNCRNLHFIHCCCGNRHCPNCQQDKAEQWLDQQMKKLLSTHYFLLTITLPQGLRDVVKSHQRRSYAALFSCVYAALKKLARDKRFIGSDRIGYMAVLHTWGSMLQLTFHTPIRILMVIFQWCYGQLSPGSGKYSAF